MGFHELPIAYFTDSDLKTKSIMDSKMTDILNRSRLEVANVSIDVVKANMVKTLDGIIEIFENEQLENRGFCVDEIEVALNVGCEGTVSVLSTVSGQASMQSSIVVKLKRSTD